MPFVWFQILLFPFSRSPCFHIHLFDVIPFEWYLRTPYVCKKGWDRDCRTQGFRFPYYNNTRMFLARVC